MNKTKTLACVAATVALGLGATACGGGGGGSDGGSGASAKFNAGVTGLANKTSKKGGTITAEISSGADSLDPGNTYYGWVQNFSRLYARTLLTFKPAPGNAGLQIVPDLATGLGTSSPDAKTWTFHLRKGVTFQDGTPVTSKDVKYAIERSNFAPEALSNGPTYFKAYLADDKSYKGPYKDKSPDGLKSIETPDAYTVVFHLSQPFADFNYLATFSQTSPVQQSKDTGASYQQHIQSTGPYEFSSFNESTGATFARNPKWKQSTDPIRKALPDKIVLKYNVNQNTIDQHLINNEVTVDIAGKGVPSQDQPKMLVPQKKGQVDNPFAGATEYLALDNNVKPFDNADCRKAVQYAVDKADMVDAIGGSVQGVAATTVIPPTVSGYAKFDAYPTPGNKGDLTKAKQYLQQCGKPNGFTTTITARSDRSDEINAATQLQATLKKIGINAQIKTSPSSKYFTDFAGVPDWVHKNDAGIMFMAWGADWPTGYGYLDQIADGAAIKPSGGTNLEELNDPAINKALADAIADTNTTSRNAAWGKIDKMIVDQGSIVPLYYRKNLLYRPPSAGNVTVAEAYLGMYDYTLMTSTS